MEWKERKENKQKGLRMTGREGEESKAIRTKGKREGGERSRSWGKE